VHRKTAMDFSKIKYKTVRNFLQKSGVSHLDDFANLDHSCSHNPDFSGYNRHIKTFLVEEPLEKVWAAYKNTGPSETFSGSMLKFGLQYSRNKKELHYPNEEYKGIEKGQIVFLNLCVLWNMVNLAVGHEVTEVNEAEKRIQTSYLKHGASEGMQNMTLESTPEGFTKITHETFYKGKSAFRDKVIYPRFHTKAITEFHGNVKRKIQSMVAFKELAK
jgi:hypothetical protein